MANTSLNPHSKHPAIPEQATGIQPDSGCLSCPLAQTDDHTSCDKFRLQNSPPVPDTARIILESIQEGQSAIHRRAFDADGIIGSQDGFSSDYWYYYNATKAINFAYFSSWRVLGISGDLVTLEVPAVGFENAKSVLLATWSERETVSPFGWPITGYYSVTATQANDMLEIQFPSKAYMLKSKILKVTSATVNQIQVQIDKDLSLVYNAFFPVDDGEGGSLPDPEFPSAKVYHYGREAENWFFIMEPHFFYGRRKQLQIQAEDLPADGIWILEPEKTIAPPESMDPLVPNFVMEGWDGTNWITISEHAQRLHIKPGHSCYALKGTLPAGSIVSSPPSNLLLTYADFRVTYYVETSVTDADCRIVAFDRCYHSRVDPDSYIANYNAAQGVGVTAEGRHVYCSERVYEEYELVDEIDKSVNPSVPGTDGVPDKVNVTLHHPTGLANFPTTTGKCIQYNYCNKHVNSLTKLGDREAPFLIDWSMVYLRELWFNGDKRLHEPYVLARWYKSERIGAPSIVWLNDYYGGMVSPHGFNEKDFPRGNGTWFPVKPPTVEDVHGNQTLVNASGFERAKLVIYNDETEVDEIDPDRRGNIPANVAGFPTKRDPFNPAATVSSDLLEYIGSRIERDSMQIVESRGLSNISMALGAEDILVPNVSFTETGVQVRSRSRFQMVEGKAEIQILPYRQDDKDEVNIGSRSIASVDSLGTGVYKLSFANETKVFSRFDAGTEAIGDSYNKIYTVQAGGGPVIKPYEHQALNSHDGDKVTGSRATGAMPLDCIEIDGHRFVIRHVGPHEGPEAGTWGNRTVVAKGSIGGFYEAPVANDPDGNPLVPIVITSVVRSSDSKVFEVVQTDDRPSAETEKLWFDGGQRLYFASVDKDDFVTVNYEDREGTTYSNTHTIKASFTVTTEVPYGEWSAAETSEIYIGADDATVTEGGSGDPAKGTVRINDVGAKIHMTFNVDNSPNDWRIYMEFAVPADPPQDDWAEGGNYLSFGKKRDIIELVADVNNGSTYFDTASVVGETASFYWNAVVFLPKTNLVVQWCFYQGEPQEEPVEGDPPPLPEELGQWQTVPSTYITVEAASGKVTVAKAWFDLTFPPLPPPEDPEDEQEVYGNVCFRVVEIQMVDNRGQVPASLLNKTEATIDSLVWSITSMGSSLGNWAYGEGIEQAWYLGCTVDPVTGEYDCSNPLTSEEPFGPYSTTFGPSNYLYIGEGGLGYETDYQNASMKVTASSFGPPPLVCNLPDGCLIEEAWAEIFSSGITRSRQRFVTQYECDGTNTVDTSYAEPVDESLTGLLYTVIGFTGPNTFEPIGEITASTPNKREVVNITAIMQLIYANRNSTLYSYGFGVVMSPGGFNEGAQGVEGFFPVSPPGYSSIQCDPEAPYPFFYFTEKINTNIEWDSVSFGQIIIKINYQGKDKLVAMHPRIPSMVDLT